MAYYNQRVIELTVANGVKEIVKVIPISSPR